MADEGACSESFGSSCDLTPMNDVFRNPLIRVSFTDFTTLFKRLTTEEKYNLSELPVNNYSGPTIDESLNLNLSEKQAVQYTVNLLGVSGLSIRVAADRRIDAYRDRLQPLTSSLIVKPDGVILSTSEFDLPLFCLEVHSSLYENTLAKSVANLIDQLRLLRCFYPEFYEVYGFVFPKLPKETYDGHIISNSACVTQVKVLWDNFLFKVEFDILRKPDVEYTVKRVVENQLRHLTTPPSQKKHFFIRLSHQDIDRFRHLVNDRNIEQLTNTDELEQIQSKFSIILKSPRFFYKMIPRVVERDTMSAFLFSLPPSRKIDGVVVPTGFPLMIQPRCSFFVFEAQDEQPLSRADAASCIGDLVEQVVVVLQRLHDLGWAHLDVRLPNICFTRDGNVRLIDLDRVHSVSEFFVDEYSGSFLYQRRLGRPVADLDWRQLGVLIYCALCHSSSIQIHKLKENDRHGNEIKQIRFLNELVFNYEMNNASLQAWKESLEESSRRSVCDVLRERQARIDNDPVV